MPNRIIREAILTSESVCSLAWPEEVFYRRLLSIVDDYGRMEANPQLLRSKCYPLQTDAVRVADITRWMAACQKSGLILVYAVQGKQYLEVQKFGQQQRTASKFPPLLANDINCSQMLTNAHLGVSVFGDVSVVVSEGEGEKPRKRDPSPAIEGIPAELLADYQAVRKAKRAGPLTATAIDGLTREAGKAGITVEQAIRACCEYGWQGFNASWYAERKATKATPQGTGETAYQRSMREKFEEASGRSQKRVIDITPNQLEILQ